MAEVMGDPLGRSQPGSLDSASQAKLELPSPPQRFPSLPLTGSGAGKYK